MTTEIGTCTKRPNWNKTKWKIRKTIGIGTRKMEHEQHDQNEMEQETKQLNEIQRNEERG